jgi:hypothetical protein
MLLVFAAIGVTSDMLCTCYVMYFELSWFMVNCHDTVMIPFCIKKKRRHYTHKQ